MSRSGAKFDPLEFGQISINDLAKRLGYCSDMQLFYEGRAGRFMGREFGLQESVWVTAAGYSCRPPRWK